MREHQITFLRWNPFYVLKQNKTSATFRLSGLYVKSLIWWTQNNLDALLGHGHFPGWAKYLATSWTDEISRAFPHLVRCLFSDVTVVVTNKLTLIRGGSHVHGGKWSQLRCPAPGPQPSVGPIAGSGPARIAESPGCLARHGLTPRPERISADRSAAPCRGNTTN